MRPKIVEGLTSVAASRRGLLKSYETSPSPVRRYFEHLPQLIAEFPLDVALAYTFSRVEFAHNMTLYCGVVKIHRADPGMARAAIDTQHMTRPQFREKYEAIYGKAISARASKLMKSAENARDKVMHGKTATEKEKREAIDNVLRYAKQINMEVTKAGGPAPFGDLRGFKGRGRSLDRSTTRWMLKGMGFPVS